MRIYVAGINGMVGSAIARLARAEGHEVVGKSSREQDFRDRESTFRELSESKVAALIIAAAKVGGIGANSRFPVEFLSENLQIQTNLIDGAHAADIKKVVFLGSSCIYPKFAPQPIKEEYLLTGILEPTNEPYAIAKIAGLKLINAYRTEFRRSWISLMPTNLYGPNDNFDLETSHVLPALIAKFHAAKISGASQVELWGDGSPLREFLHVDDLASATLFLLQNYDGDVAINVGTSVDMSVKDLAEKIAKVVGFSGAIRWDASRPNGTPRKLLDSSMIRNMGWLPQIDLDHGLQATYEWYRANSEERKGS